MSTSIIMLREDIFYRYLYKVTYQLIYNVLEEKAADMVVREEDKKHSLQIFTNMGLLVWY